MAKDDKFEKIKDNVWKLKKTNDEFSVKRYYSFSTVSKVKKVHKALQALSFPHVVPVVQNKDELTVVQPWLQEASAVNFKKKSDRTDSLEALNALHATKKDVNWSSFSYLQPYPLVLKWQDRMNRFRAIREVCEVYIGEQAVEDILFYAENAFRMIQKTYVSQLDETLLHGDVVHHNILRDQNGIIRLIDFDLACVGPEGTELALWIHRVLPNIDYDIEFLMDEQPSLRSLNNVSKSLLLYPNELLREWLHFFSLSPSAREKQVKNLVPFTASALSHWPKLWYNVERMKN